MKFTLFSMNCLLF